MTCRRCLVSGTVATFALIAVSVAAGQEASPGPTSNERVLIVEAVDVTPGRTAIPQPAPPVARVSPSQSVSGRHASPAPTAIPAHSRKTEAVNEWEVEEIDGEVRRSQGEWLLKIEYEVREKSKVALSNDAATLLIELHEAGRPVVREDDTPVVLEVPLDRPTDSEKRKREFEGKLHISLGEEYHGDIENLELVARVELDATHEIVAQDDDEVDFDDDGGIRGFGLTLFGFGGGLCW